MADESSETVVPPPEQLITEESGDAPLPDSEIQPSDDNIEGTPGSDAAEALPASVDQVVRDEPPQDVESQSEGAAGTLPPPCEVESEEANAPNQNAENSPVDDDHEVPAVDAAEPTPVVVALDPESCYDPPLQPDECVDGSAPPEVIEDGNKDAEEAVVVDGDTSQECDGNTTPAAPDSSDPPRADVPTDSSTPIAEVEKQEDETRTNDNEEPAADKEKSGLESEDSQKAATLDSGSCSNPPQDNASQSDPLADASPQSHSQKDANPPTKDAEVVTLVDAASVRSSIKPQVDVVQPTKSSKTRKPTTGAKTKVERMPAWQSVYQRLLDWAGVWSSSTLQASLDSTAVGNKVDEVALVIWTMQQYKRHLRSIADSCPVNLAGRVFIPPNIAIAIDKAVYSDRLQPAREILQNWCHYIGLTGMPSTITALVPGSGDEEELVLQFLVPEKSLTIFHHRAKYTSTRGRHLKWWLAICAAWPTAFSRKDDYIYKKVQIVPKDIPAPAATSDMSLSAASVCYNLIIGNPAEKSLNLQRVRDLISREVNSLKRRKKRGAFDASIASSASRAVPPPPRGDGCRSGDLNGNYRSSLSSTGMPTKSGFHWELPGLNVHRFIALTCLLSMRNGGRMPTEEDDECELTDEDLDEVGERGVPSNRDSLIRRFLDNFSEVMAFEKDAKFVAASVMRCQRKTVEIWVSRNGGFQARDSDFFLKFKTFMETIAASSSGSSHLNQSASAERDLFMAMVSHYTPRLRNTYIPELRYLLPSMASSYLGISGNTGLRALLLQLNTLSQSTNPSCDLLANLVDKAFEISQQFSSSILPPKLWINIRFVARLRYAHLTFVRCARKLNGCFASIRISQASKMTFHKTNPRNEWTLSKVLSHLGLSANTSTICGYVAAPSSNKDAWKRNMTEANSQLHSRSSAKRFVHAEVQLVLHLLREGLDLSELYGYMGCSKRSCFMCQKFLQYFKVFQTRGTHHRLYHLWIVPEDPGLTPKHRETLTYILNQVEGDLKRRLLTRITMLEPYVEESCPGASPSTDTVDFHPLITGPDIQLPQRDEDNDQNAAHSPAWEFRIDNGEGRNSPDSGSRTSGSALCRSSTPTQKALDSVLNVPSEFQSAINNVLREGVDERAVEISERVDRPVTPASTASDSDPSGSATPRLGQWTIEAQAELASAISRSPVLPSDFRSKLEVSSAAVGLTPQVDADEPLVILPSSPTGLFTLSEKNGEVPQCSDDCVSPVVCSHLSGGSDASEITPHLNGILVPLSELAKDGGTQYAEVDDPATAQPASEQSSHIQSQASVIRTPKLTQTPSNVLDQTNGIKLATWQRVHQRLLNWVNIWSSSQLQLSLDSTIVGHSVDEVALTVWSMQMYKRFLRSNHLGTEIDCLFIPPNIANAIDKAVYCGNLYEARELLQESWQYMAIQGVPSTIIAFVPCNDEEEHEVLRFHLPAKKLTIFDLREEVKLRRTSHLSWWLAIRQAWISAFSSSDIYCAYKRVQIVTKMTNSTSDSGLRAVAICYNLMEGDRPERDLDLQRVRELMNREMRSLMCRKRIGDLDAIQ